MPPGVRTSASPLTTLRVLLVDDSADDAQHTLEARLRQAQKMEAIGQLAGGVAHDFNNLLTAIRGYAKFAADSLPVGGQCRLDMEEVIKAGRRAADLTRQLKANRGQPHVQKPFTADQLVSYVRSVLDGRPAPTLRGLA